MTVRNDQRRRGWAGVVGWSLRRVTRRTTRLAGRWAVVVLLAATPAQAALGWSSLAYRGTEHEERAVGQPSQEAATEQFVPLDELPPEDRLAAAPLLIAAYAFAWLMVAGYLFSIWRRLARVERELADVRHRRPGSDAGS